MSEPAALPSASRLFAWELSLAQKTSGGFKTPFGDYAEQTALLGTLTDITAQDGVVSLLRISDPTGICNAVPDRNNAALMESAAKLEAPSFLYLFGTLRIRTHRGTAYPELSAEDIQPVS
ncbi:MAG: hypothetical protein Q4Q04_03090, partial [Methanocorpusculum sp.]|nr:hypothetical protein [Methanocorpusculum sp.]